MSKDKEKEIVTTKVFDDFAEKIKKIQRSESFKQDKSMTIPETVDWLVDEYLEKQDKDSKKSENDNTLNVIL